MFEAKQVLRILHKWSTSGGRSRRPRSSWPSRSALVQRGEQRIRIAPGEQAVRVDQLRCRAQRFATPGHRRGGRGSGRGCRSDGYPAIYWRLHRQVGEGLKDRARRSFHSFEPRSFGEMQIGIPVHGRGRTFYRESADGHSGDPSVLRYPAVPSEEAAASAADPEVRLRSTRWAYLSNARAGWPRDGSQIAPGRPSS